jgi:MarR family transcriptional regulator, organic hydroperoxide resistance regulator
MESTQSVANTDPGEFLRLDRQLCFALYSASLAMTRLYKPHLENLGLTYPQYLVMLALWERDGLGVNELGQRLCLDSGTLTPLLKRLSLAGWVTRERNPTDERRVLVSLTPAGLALRQAALSVPLAIASASGCTLEELGTLTRELQGLRMRLDRLQPPEGAAAA